MKLTNTQKQLIIESLLFAACAEISGNWSEEQHMEMIDLATSLKDEETKLTNISVYKLSEYDVENITQTIIEKFKESLNVEEDRPEQFFID
jgi:hypothetical protein